jgi:CheY-like chemotaxis protein
MSVLDIAASQTGPAPLSVELAPWDDVKAGARLYAETKPFVLVIEDNLGDVLLVEEALREHQIDCDLTVVDDGEEAMRLIQSIDGDPTTRSPTLVLLDLNLPKCSGYEILDRIRRSARCPTMPVVIVTSSQAPSDLAQTKQLGATAYFHKPVSFDEFMKLGAVVRNLL